MQKLVRGATKPKSTAPKAKYIEPILASTYEGGHDFEVVMESLARTITGRNVAWPSVYKSLIVVHIMIREGAQDTTLMYASRHPRMFDLEEYSHRAPAMERYARYLATKAHEFRATEIDYVRYRTRQGLSRLYKLTVDEGLLKECRSVLVQLDSLCKCQYQEQDIVSDDVLLMAFRLLVHDALSLFQVLNEGVINLLEHFFELTHSDAETALEIYRSFRNITNRVIQYLRIAKDFEFKTMLHIPNIKHAPTSLVSSLEMYLNDPDFDKNRKQYLSEKHAHVQRTRSRTSISSRTPSRSASGVQRARSSAGTKPAAQQPTQPQAQPVQPVQPAQQVQPVQQPVQQVQPVQPVQAVQQQPTQIQPIQPVQPDLSMNPFWQAQTGASNIQTVDTQAQTQMQQLQQLQQQQAEQQERIRAQLQQLQQSQPVQQPVQQPIQPVQQPVQAAAPHIDFDFGVPTQPSIQSVQPMQSIQPVQQSIQPVQAQGVQPQTLMQTSIVPTQASEFNPFRSSVGTNPFQSGQAAQQPMQQQMTGPLVNQYTGGITAQTTGLANQTTGMQPYGMQSQYTGPQYNAVPLNVGDLSGQSTNPFRA